jgi:hypothetical protein
MDFYSTTSARLFPSSEITWVRELIQSTYKERFYFTSYVRELLNLFKKAFTLVFNEETNLYDNFMMMEKIG